MTYEQREKIFSKEYLSIIDLQNLFGLDYQGSAKLIRDIKRELQFNPKYNGQGVRLNTQGRLHVQDYLDYYQISNMDRYNKSTNTNINKELNNES